MRRETKMNASFDVILSGAKDPRIEATPQESRGSFVASLLRMTFILGVVAVAGFSPDSDRSVPLGAWGGTGVALTVEESGATLEFDCAHGSITGRLALDTNGRFELPGKFVRERPGPVRMGPNGEAEENAEPATYSGRMDDGALLLTIRLEKGARVVDGLRLEQGKTPRLHKCL
jgi:hypothetical protein